MPKRIANSTLNGSTIDILNVIRANASYEYQSLVPTVKTANDIPKVGEVIYGHPAFANQFLNSLINRIALVQLQSATFNNPYAGLKKGYLEFGETVEEIFVAIAKAVEFDPEKANAREFKRTFPDVKSAFHVMNWRVMYPITIQDEDLKQAFLSMEGVQELIGKIVEQVYTGAEYDEFLLFKYLLIKAITAGKTYPISIGDETNLENSAIEFRATSNLLPFLGSDYNEAGVLTNTPKDRQVIFMDARFNAKYDVEVLASAFNMDKADFMGRLYLIDNWDKFDNDRFDVIRANSDGIEEVTESELALMKDIKAVMCDSRWFQVYDNNNKFTEKYVASGLYWNYFYHTWKTISNSPFSNIVTFVADTADIALPTELTAHVSMVDETKEVTAMTITVESENATLQNHNVNFVQTEALTTAGIAVHPYGALMIPASAFATDITLVVEINGTQYTAGETINASTAVDTAVTLTKA